MSAQSFQTAAQPAGQAAPVKPSLTLKRRLKAPPEMVFAAWTEPAQIARWFGPGEVTVERAEADPRVGGRFHVIFRGDDGEAHDVSGVYRAVEPNAKLVFTWAWRTTPERESLVTVLIKPDPATPGGNHTLMTLIHEQFFDAAARDGHLRGWSGSLDKLERLFA